MYDRLAIDLKHIKEELVGIQARLQTMYDMESLLEGVENVLENQVSS